MVALIIRKDIDYIACQTSLEKINRLQTANDQKPTKYASHRAITDLIHFAVESVHVQFGIINNKRMQKIDLSV